MFAEQIMGAAQGVGFSDALLEMFYEEFDLTEWRRERNRAYPPYYAYAKGRYPANPRAVEKLRRNLRRVPRVNPEDYDILLNIEGSSWIEDGPTWDIVKWVSWPEFSGVVPGVGVMTVVCYEPLPIYHIPAWRSPLSLGDSDFNEILRNAVTIRGGEEISEEILESNRAKYEAAQARRMDEDLDFAEYYRGLFKKTAENLGI